MRTAADDDRPVRLLVLTIHEPLPGRVFPEMIADHGPEEAARRYRAVVLTTLRQLRGLEDTRIRILPEPMDAAEALRFWLLPRLADRWQMDGAVFRSSGWEIDFGETGEPFPIQASGEAMCPFLGARWLHAAMLGLERGEHRVIGPAACGGEYLRAGRCGTEHLEPRLLPELPVIRHDGDWRQILTGPLGAALKKAWEAEA